MGSDDEESVDVVFVYIKQSAMWSLIISYILSAISYWGIFHKAGRPGILLKTLVSPINPLRPRMAGYYTVL